LFDPDLVDDPLHLQDLFQGGQRQEIGPEWVPMQDPDPKRHTGVVSSISRETRLAQTPALGQPCSIRFPREMTVKMAGFSRESPFDSGHGSTGTGLRHGMTPSSFTVGGCYLKTNPDDKWIHFSPAFPSSGTVKQWNGSRNHVPPIGNGDAGRWTPFTSV
jgi:hypothetical protein